MLLVSLVFVLVDVWEKMMGLFFLEVVFWEDVAMVTGVRLVVELCTIWNIGTSLWGMLLFRMETVIISLAIRFFSRQSLRKDSFHFLVDDVATLVNYDLRRCKRVLLALLLIRNKLSPWVDMLLFDSRLWRHHMALLSVQNTAVQTLDKCCFNQLLLFFVRNFLVFVLYIVPNDIGLRVTEFLRLFFDLRRYF